MMQPWLEPSGGDGAAADGAAAEEAEEAAALVRLTSVACCPVGAACGPCRPALDRWGLLRESLSSSAKKQAAKIGPPPPEEEAGPEPEGSEEGKAAQKPEEDGVPAPKPLSRGGSKRAHFAEAPAAGGGAALRRNATLPSPHAARDLPDSLKLRRTQTLPSPSPRPVEPAVQPVSLLSIPLQRCRSSRQIGRTRSTAATLDTHRTLRIDPSLRRGRLPNGVRWYLKHCSSPSQEIQLRAVVRAGSVDELPKERGIAHFVEHLVFRGSTNFTDGQIDEQLLALGCQNGADNNAMTTFDHTSYRLMVPWRSDDASKGMPAVRTCLEMLCDVSDRPTFSSV